MPVFTVNIACRTLGHDYASLFAALRNAHGLCLLETRWLIHVAQDLRVVTAALLSHCAEGDGLFVTELAPETRWSGTGLGNEVRAWIAARSTKAQRSQGQMIKARMN